MCRRCSGIFNLKQMTMKNENRNLSNERNRPGALENRNTEKDIRKSERDLGPHSGMRPDHFPESRMHKDQREDAERVKREKDDSNIEDLATDVEGTVGSRTTGSSPEDIAGVSDLDRGMRRSRRNR